MDVVEYSKFVFALIFVLALIGVTAWIARRFNLLPGPSRKLRPGQRLQTIEMLPLDSKRKLLLIRRDEQEHLLLLGADRETVVESWPAAEVTGNSDNMAIQPADEARA